MLPAVPTILVIEVDEQQRRAIEIALTARGFDVSVVGDGRSAREAVETMRPDLVLLDLGLPDIDGIHLCRHLHVWPAAPIIVVSTDDDDARIVAALDGGADDYVVKPCTIDVLVARIRVQLRHASLAAPMLIGQVLSVGDVRLDNVGHEVDAGGARLELNVQQFTILMILMRNVGTLVTYEVVARAVGRGSGAVDRNGIRVNVSRLRRQLGDGPDRPQIITERHVGYRLVSPHV